MTGRARRRINRDTSTPDISPPQSTAWTRLPSGEPTLDQLFAEPIMQQLMRRDRTDKATIHRLLRQTTAARSVSRTKNDPNTIVRLLHDAARLWRSRYDREVCARIPGMTRARCTVLIHLAQHNGVHQAALARILNIRPMTLARLIDRLEAADVVARMPDPDDRRVRVLVLTAKALPIIEHIYDLTRKTDDDLQLGISKTEANQLHALLYRIRSNLMGRLGEDPSSKPIRARAHA